MSHSPSFRPYGVDPIGSSAPSEQKGPSRLTRGLSIIVPVFNGRDSLDELVDRLHAQCTNLGRAFEIILIDDGSPDGSWERILAIAEARGATVHGIRMMRNYGQHNAVLCGVRAARYDVSVTLDDDLQHPPEAIPLLLGELENGFDVVYGTPRQQRHSTPRNLVTRLVRRAIAWAIGVKSIENINAFRAFRTNLRVGFSDFSNTNPLFDALLSWSTTRFSAVEVEHAERKHGRSNYSFRRLVNQTLYMLTAYSTVPLRIASLVGLAFVGFGALILVYVVGRFYLEGSTPGFPFLASVISLFSGAQLFALGMLGEYVAHIFVRSMDRPAYVVGEVARANPAARRDRQLAAIPLAANRP